MSYIITHFKNPLLNKEFQTKKDLQHCQIIICNHTRNEVVAMKDDQEEDGWLHLHNDKTADDICDCELFKLFNQQTNGSN